MDVILLERVEKLGQMGDVVSVRAGYGRNYLLAQGKALRASAANKSRFENQKSQLEARNLEAKSEAQQIADRLNGQQFVIIRQAGDAGQLYGSVTNRDASDKMTEEGFSLDRRQVQIITPIKDLGLHAVSVRLHPEVSADVTLNVARSTEESEIQALGKSIAQLRAEEEAAEIAEMSANFEGGTDFDVDALFDEESDDAAAEGDDQDDDAKA